MAFQSVPDTALAEVLMTDASAVLKEMTFYFRRAGGYLTDDLEALADAVDAWGASDLRPQLSNEVTYVRTEVRGLEFENDQVIVRAVGTGLGAVASPRLPSNVSLAIRRLSGFTGRSARGRVYWYGAPENQVAGNLYEVAYVAAIIAAFNSLSDDAFALGWQPVIVSRFSGGVKRPTGITFALTSWSEFDRRVDTMSRRLD